MNTQFHLVAKTKATKTTFGLWIPSFLQKKYIYIKKPVDFNLYLICLKVTLISFTFRKVCLPLNDHWHERQADRDENIICHTLCKETFLPPRQSFSSNMKAIVCNFSAVSWVCWPALLRAFWTFEPNCLKYQRHFCPPILKDFLLFPDQLL